MLREGDQYQPLKAWGENYFPSLNRKTWLTIAKAEGFTVKKFGGQIYVRRRNEDNRDLPRNLYADGNSYRYRHPITKRKFSLGTNRKQAILALNSRVSAALYPSGVPEKDGEILVKPSQQQRSRDRHQSLCN